MWRRWCWAGCFRTTLSGNTTSVADASFVGAPDDSYGGLGTGGSVASGLGDYRVVDGGGGDFNVYEVDSGSPEFTLLRVEVSADGINFVDISNTQAAKVNISSDQLHGDASFAQSYQLAGSGLIEKARLCAKFTGTGGGTPGGSRRL